MSNRLNLRLMTAIVAGKAAALASRTLGAGGGTTLPGAVARRIDPTILRQLSARLPEGVVLIGGTNGKTTTARMLATLLEDAGCQVLHNRAGANLLPGLTATALAGSSLGGVPRAMIGLFETDEAALPDALAETTPRLVLLHNLFRDQLDRYGEVDTIARSWRAALEQLPASSTVLLNADDPAVADLGSGLNASVAYYGLEDTSHAVSTPTTIADSQFCRRCGAPYRYSALFYAHMGHYVCPQCGHSRPQPQYRLERLELEGTDQSRLTIGAADGCFELRLPLPGRYNALNALAASAAALLLGVTPAQIAATLGHFSAAFGRIERVEAEGTPLFLALIKNPIGASETLRMLIEGQPAAASLHLLIAINDKYADGTDVSWLWDANFEQIAGHVATATISGTRAADMAVRLKYAGADPSRLRVEPDLARALDVARAALPGGATLYILPTYTAMLELRAELARHGWVQPFWKD